MKKVISVFIPIVVLSMFILIMLSGNYLKYPLKGEEGIPKSIEILIKDVEENQWDKAAKDLEKLENVWGKVVKRIQFSSERDEINAFNSSLARIGGAIKGRSLSMSLMELYEAYDHWEGLAK